MPSGLFAAPVLASRVRVEVMAVANEADFIKARRFIVYKAREEATALTGIAEELLVKRSHRGLFIGSADATRTGFHAFTETGKARGGKRGSQAGRGGHKKTRRREERAWRAERHVP